jgi:hypothetical protein
MALHWYTVVVDCHDIAAQSRWWAETLGYTIAFEAADEVAIIPSDWEARDLSWEHTPPGLVFVPVAEGKTVKNRLHIDLAPHTSDDRDAEIARLLERGAALADVGQSADASWTVLTDPEGNEFCVLSSRDE